MPRISNDRLATIAHLLHDCAAAVGEIRLDAIHDGAALNDPKIVQLLSLQLGLLDKSSSFFIQAAQITLQDADKAADQITLATQAAKDALDTLRKVDKAITIASAIGVLAASVLTGQMGSIGEAAKGVFEAIQSDSDENSTKTGSSSQATVRIEAARLGITDY